MTRGTTSFADTGAVAGNAAARGSVGRERLCAFVTFFLLYAATSPGDLVADSEIRWDTARRLVSTGWIALETDTNRFCATGVDGRPYSFYAPGQSMCLTVFVVVGQFLARLPLPDGASADMLGQFAASLAFFPACGAFAVMLLYSIVWDLTHDRAAARWVAVIHGLGTMHWQHTVSTGDESQVAVSVLASLWAMQRAWSHDGPRYPMLACLAMGLGFWFRTTSVLATAPLGLIGFAVDLRGRPGRRWTRLRAWIAAGAVGIAPFVAATAWLNHARFGSIFETGYGPAHDAIGVGLFETPLWVGLGGILISPGKSLFLYNPILILAVVGFVSLWRTHRPIAVLAIAMFVCNVLVHARYTYWAGDLTWGTRFVASILGVLCLGLVPCCVEKVRDGNLAPALRTAFVSIFAISAAVQVASVVYSFGLEFAQDRRHGTVPDEYVWRPTESHLLRRFENIARHVAGRRRLESIPPAIERPAFYQTRTTPEEVRMAHAVSFFPFKAAAHLGSGTVFAAMLTMWMGMLAGSGYFAWRWRRG
jgi:hypothetical protein